MVRTTTVTDTVKIPYANNDIVRRVFRGKTYLRIGVIRKEDRTKYKVIITDYIISQKVTKITEVEVTLFSTAVAILNKYVPASNV